LIFTGRDRFCCVIPKIVIFSHYQIAVLHNLKYFPRTQTFEESVKLLLTYVPQQTHVAAKFKRCGDLNAIAVGT